jgi:hypothetical protein
MPMYTVGRSNFALSTATDSLAIVSSAYPIRIHIMDLKGLGISSSANEAILFRATTVGSTGLSGAITPSNVNSNGAASKFGVYSAFASTTATTAGAPLWRFAPNGNGGIDKFTAPRPELAISMPSSAYALLRASVGAGSFSANIVVEELDF